MKNLLLLLLSFFIFSCSSSEEKGTENPPKQVSHTPKISPDSIIKEHLRNGAWKHGLYTKEYQDEIDKGIEKDSTIAYLWQQKAMPLFKQGKYELGLSFLDKAVKYKPEEWLEYRAFMKCIFVNNYRSAIQDFNEAKSRFGNSYVMDHSYDFYIALSKIQLNEYEEAEGILIKEVNKQTEELGKDWVHYLVLFYLGIAKYEQGKYQGAINTFDACLALNPKFADAFYYKGICTGKLGATEEGDRLIEQGKIYGDQGFSINEDNAIYERYPYQIRW